MNTPLIREGKLVPAAFDGADLSALSTEQANGLQAAITKDRNGQRLTGDDLRAVMKARQAAQPTNPLDRLGRSLADFNRSLHKGG